MTRNGERNRQNIWYLQHWRNNECDLPGIEKKSSETKTRTNLSSDRVVSSEKIRRKEKIKRSEEGKQTKRLSRAKLERTRRCFSSISSTFSSSPLFRAVFFVTSQEIEKDQNISKRIKIGFDSLWSHLSLLYGTSRMYYCWCQRIASISIMTTSNIICPRWQNQPTQAIQSQPLVLPTNRHVASAKAQNCWKASAYLLYMKCSCVTASQYLRSEIRKQRMIWKSNSRTLGCWRLDGATEVQSATHVMKCKGTDW